MFLAFYGFYLNFKIIDMDTRYSLITVLAIWLLYSSLAHALNYADRGLAYAACSNETHNFYPIQTDYNSAMSAGCDSLIYSLPNGSNPYYRSSRGNYFYFPAPPNNCPTGRLWNDSLKICAYACNPSGTIVDLPIRRADQVSSPPGYVYSVDVSGDMVAGYTAKYNQNNYTFTQADYSGTCAINTQDNNAIYCLYHAKATGVCDAGANTILPPNMGTPINTNVNHAGGGCIVDARGNTTCTTNKQSIRQCGTVNNNTVCVDTTSGTGTVNGLAYQTSQKNCGYLNGQPVCVSNDGSSATTVGCVQNGGVRQCVNSDIKISENSSSVANTDGSVTKTTIKSDNVIGDTDITTTTITRTDGSTTTSTSGGNGNGGFGSGAGGIGSGSGIDGKASPTDCDKFPNSAGCVLASSVKTDCDKFPTSEGCQTVSQNLGTFTDPGSLTIRSITGTYSPLSGYVSGGTCPADISLSVLGKTYHISWTPICDFASGLRPIITLMAYVSSAFIIFGAGI